MLEGGVPLSVVASILGWSPATLRLAVYCFADRAEFYASPPDASHPAPRAAVFASRRVGSAVSRLEI